MSSTSNSLDTLERHSLRQTNLNNLRNYQPINHPGYIDERKQVGNIRILSLNTKGINPWNQYRMNLLKQSINKHEIDIILLNETQLK